MKSKNHVVLMLAAAVLAFGGATTAMPAANKVAANKVADSASKPGRRLPIVLPRDGGGPLCMPSTGCGYR